MNGGKQPSSMPLPPHLGGAAAAAAGTCFSGRYSPTYRAAPPDPMRGRHCAMGNPALTFGNQALARAGGCHLSSSL
ncbi:unnamed protein product [Ixodes pacificus]